MTGPHHVLFYDYVDDILERRDPFREDHLAHAREWNERGDLVAAGALGDPPHGAAFVFALNDVAAIEGFVASDPYREAGLITDWRIDPWNVVVGD